MFYSCSNLVIAQCNSPVFEFEFEWHEFNIFGHTFGRINRSIACTECNISGLIIVAWKLETSGPHLYIYFTSECAIFLFSWMVKFETVEYWLEIGSELPLQSQYCSGNRDIIFRWKTIRKMFYLWFENSRYSKPHFFKTKQKPKSCLDDELKPLFSDSIREDCRKFHLNVEYLMNIY